MHIDYFKSLLDKHEDVVLHFKKKAPLAVTHNLETPYIKKFIRGEPKQEGDKYPVWSWTTNKLISVDTKEIKFVEPLSSILGNKNVS